LILTESPSRSASRRAAGSGEDQLDPLLARERRH